MTRLLAERAFDAPETGHGAAAFRGVEPGRITWLAPHPGHETELSHLLKSAFSLCFPAPGEAHETAAGRILWSGRSQALLIGPRAPEGLEAHAAVIDQSDGWAAFRLSGEDAAAVLARLTPLDLRAAAFPPGRTARTLLGHMTAQITHRDGGFEILVMRSMARTAAHEIADAMRSVAARRRSG